MLYNIDIILQYKFELAMSKSETLSLRLDPETKRALRALAKEDLRSVTKTIEYLIISHCRERGIIPPLDAGRYKREPKKRGKAN
jgi:hypothetical protein